jgi:RNA recognition motif-containing protein
MESETPDHPGAPMERMQGSTDPSCVLFADDLPVDYSQLSLQMLFSQCSGFLDLRLAKKRSEDGEQHSNVAFIEFSDEVSAGMALKQLHGFQISSSHYLKLSYGKS